MTDADLVRRLKAHDDTAYREVVARYGDLLCGYIYSLLGDRQLSEDVLSETYLCVVEKIDSYTFYGPPFKAWLFRIAHNRALNMLKRARRTVRLHDSEIVAPAADDPTVVVGTQLEAAALRRALAHLTEEQQQVVLLRFVADTSPAEVADALDKTANAVKQMQFRALRSLARLLEEDDDHFTENLLPTCPP